TTAGTANNFTVTAKDALGNVATGYRGTVAITSSDAAAVKPANYTFTAADNGGPHTLSVTLKTAGTRSITATDTITSITGSQTGIIVNPAAATTLTVTAPTTASAGVPISVVVTAKDAFTNTATGYLG